MEQFANNASSTLSAAITSTTATTLTVTSASTFPGTGNFRIKIDTEILIVTGVSGTTFTVTRGAESTTAATHLNTAPVTHILTAGGLAQYVTDHGGGGATPSPFGVFTAPPVAADFTAVNNSTATLTDQTIGATSSVLLSVPGNNGETWQLWKRPVPATPYSVVVAMMPLLDPFSGSGLNRFGLGFLDSTGDNFSALIFKGIGLEPELQVLSNLGGILANVTTAADFSLPPIVWMKISDDSTNRSYSISADGVNWLLVKSEASTESFAPASVMLFLDSNSGGNASALASGGSQLTLLSYTE
ncbi:MAG TPA: hypothetical protein VHY91_14555 [Pirellulales bacterium]|jgi:hypothetical protein|nr:hypothetical protein [Pirellulales bacterium]